MKENILHIKTVHQCNCCLGCKTLHPLVNVIDLAQTTPGQQAVKFDFYTVLLLENETEAYLYGRKYYDYSNASVVFFAPGQFLTAEGSGVLPQKGRLLVFHPDLICHTSLGRNIKNYTFFFYRPEEALHLSLREKTKVNECLNNIGEELRHAIDCYSKTLISRHIELLLDYCSRFYERQFITRNEANKEIVGNTDFLIDEYIRSGQLQSGLPSAAYCAGLLHLSPHYFSDLLKFETGKSLYEYVQQKRLDTSRKLLLDKNNTVSMVAHQLGYANVQYFSCLFKKITGIAPQEYRLSQS